MRLICLVILPMGHISFICMGDFQTLIHQASFSLHTNFPRTTESKCNSEKSPCWDKEIRQGTRRWCGILIGLVILPTGHVRQRLKTLVHQASFSLHPHLPRTTQPKYNPEKSRPSHWAPPSSVSKTLSNRLAASDQQALARHAQVFRSVLGEHWSPGQCAATDMAPRKELDSVVLDGAPAPFSPSIRSRRGHQDSAKPLRTCDARRHAIDLRRPVRRPSRCIVHVVVASRLTGLRFIIPRDGPEKYAN